MASITTYYAGGFQAAAAAQNKAEQWSNGTQAADPAAGYTRWNQDGSVAASRALTASEAAQLAATDTSMTAVVNTQTLQQKAQNALTANVTFLALASPTNTDVVAQVRALTKECSALIRLLLGQLDSTAGT